MPVYLHIVMMFAFSILFVQDFNIVLVSISFYINSFSFLFIFSLGFLSSSRSRVRERLPNHFRSRFSFVHENNTATSRSVIFSDLKYFTKKVFQLHKIHSNCI